MFLFLLVFLSFLHVSRLGRRRHLHTGCIPFLFFFFLRAFYCFVMSISFTLNRHCFNNK